MKRAKVCAVTLAILINIATGSVGAYAQEAAPYYPSMPDAYGMPGPGGYGGAPITTPVMAPIMPFSFAAEGLGMWRQDSFAHTLVKDFGPGGATVVTVDDLNRDTGLGMRFTGTLHPGWSDIEVVCFGIDNWGSSQYSTSTSWGYTLPDLNDGNAYTSTVAIYDSKLYNGEVNLRSPLFFDCLTGIMGFRWSELQEYAGVWGFANSGTSRSWSVSRVANDLFGFQIGGNLAVGLAPGFSVSSTVKGGVYSNQLRWQRDAANQLEGTSDSRDQRDGRVAFIGELGVRGTWELAPHLSAFGGYQVMWLSGVAMAPGSTGHDDHLDLVLRPNPTVPWSHGGRRVPLVNRALADRGATHPNLPFRHRFQNKIRLQDCFSSRLGESWNSPAVF